jgi:cell division protein FtsL
MVSDVQVGLGTARASAKPPSRPVLHRCIYPVALAERSLQIILVVTTLFVAVFIFVPPATVTVKILGNTEVRRRGTDQ